MGNKKNREDIRTSLKFRSASKKSDKNSTYSPNPKTYTLKDYQWTIEEINGLNNVPLIRLMEFQPKFIINSALLLGAGLKSIIGVVGKIANIATLGIGGNISKSSKGVFRDEFIKQIAQSKVTDELISKYTTEGKSTVLGTPQTFIKRLFSGNYLNIFEIPFFNDEYINADSASSWSGGSISEQINSDIFKVISENMSMNFPMRPIWKKTEDNKIELEITLPLINDNTDNLVKNFTFLHSLSSGNFWTQLDYIQYSPNVFDVLVPGRLHMYFAAIGINISYKGKRRRNEEACQKIGLNNVKADSMFFPEIYSLTIKITDLTPNNFNNYLDTLDGTDWRLQYNSGDSVPEGKEFVIQYPDINKDVLKPLSEKVKKMTSDFKDKYQK